MTRLCNRGYRAIVGSNRLSQQCSSQVLQAAEQLSSQPATHPTKHLHQVDMLVSVMGMIKYCSMHLAQRTVTIANTTLANPIATACCCTAAEQPLPNTVGHLPGSSQRNYICCTTAARSCRGSTLTCIAFQAATAFCKTPLHSMSQSSDHAVHMTQGPLRTNTVPQVLLYSSHAPP